MTNSRIIAMFLQVSKSEKNLSPKTIKAYQCDLQQFAKIIGAKRFRNIRMEDLRHYLQVLAQRGFADTTIKRKIATLKVLFRFLQDENLVPENPTGKLKHKFKVSQRLPKVMSPTDVQCLLQTAHRLVRRELKHPSKPSGAYQRLRDCVMLELLFTTGIRGEELLRIQVPDIDLTTRSLVIHGKGRKERILYISSDEVLHTAKQYLRHRSFLNTNSSALFLNRYKQPLGVQSLRNVFSAACKLAGIDRRFTPHCLRHTMATMLLENGADVRSVQEILGHSRISTTEIYLEVSQRRKQEVLRKFNQRNFFHFT